MLRIGVIDYGVNNIHSISKALDRIGVPYDIISNDHEINSLSHIILPGVGAFGAGMKALKNADLDKTIKNLVLSGVPILGICLGMQLLYETSLESEGVLGLGLLSGHVALMQSDIKNNVFIPHVGWNEINIIKESPLLNDIPNATDFYFVHSFCVSPKNTDEILVECLHGENFPAIVKKDKIVGVQFHPEKSLTGLKFIKSFLLL